MNDIIDIETGESLEKKELFEQYKFIADPGQKKIRIDKYLVDRITNISRNRIQDTASCDQIIVNGVPVKSNYKVRAGDVISVMVSSPPRDTELIPEDIPLNIVYEDDFVMLINKPAGMVVHPGHGNFSGTLVNGLAWYFKDNSSFAEDDSRPGLVHRIDKDTSGLLVVAKTPQAKANLTDQFFHKTTERKYIALVWGEPEEMEGTIEGSIGRNPRDRTQMALIPEENGGKSAVTHYKVLEKFGYVTLVECKLETGRTHQIRVHMKSIGHPLFNDAKYGGDQILRGTRYSRYTQFVKNCFSICPRQALHAKTLGFNHPDTGEWCFFNSEIPQDMSMLIEKWRAYISQRKF